jgi:uncharacterized protein YijF (DUF1287 family)
MRISAPAIKTGRLRPSLGQADDLRSLRRLKEDIRYDAAFNRLSFPAGIVAVSSGLRAQIHVICAKMGQYGLELFASTQENGPACLLYFSESAY